MEWAVAVRLSKVSVATRLLTDGLDREGKEPNVVLLDQKFNPPRPKVFRAVETYGWIRRAIKVAREFDDWEPTKDR